MLTTKQKQLILTVLQKENKRMFSKFKGELMNQTIDDLRQMLRNEHINSEGRGFDNVVHFQDRKKR